MGGVVRTTPGVQAFYVGCRAWQEQEVQVHELYASFPIRIPMMLKKSKLLDTLIELGIMGYMGMQGTASGSFSLAFAE